jgi:hypothetical protein
MLGEKDFYYSQKAFGNFKTMDNPYIYQELVCEVLINGEWKVFTEQITKGIPALSVWEDLIYLGSSSETKYTNAVEWNKQRKLI